MRLGFVWLAGALVAVCACSTEESGAPADAGGDVLGEPCQYFTHSGDVCPVPTKQVCFPECTTGGCACRAGADGVLRWSCVTDLTCVPESGPLDDTGTGDDDAASGDDATVQDASGDAGASDADASDADADADAG